MAALTFVLLSAGEQFFRVICVFFKSGFSISKCVDYIQETRREYLFKRYIKELNDTVTVDSKNKTYSRSVTTKYQQKPEQHLRVSLKNQMGSSEDEDIEIIQGFEINQIPSNTAFYDFIDPHVVYLDNNLAELTEGSSFMITGTLFPNCERFAINFILNTPTRDVALHINPRLPQNYIVRNCKIKGIWGQEDVTSTFPISLHRGKNFSIQILVTELEFLIAVNGKHFSNFTHRLPFKKITCLEIKGDIDNVKVERSTVSSYPITSNETESKIIHSSDDTIDEQGSPSTSHDLKTPKDWSSKIICGLNEESLELPFYGKLQDKFISGKCLRIEGRVKMLPHSFKINLQNSDSIWPHPVIAFHFNPRFANIGGQHVICRNSWIVNKWGKEERTEMKTDFMPGKSFTLYIYCGSASYDVYLNKQFLMEYIFRVRPEIVDTVYVEGDIKLWNIVLEKGVPKHQLHE